jgi:hypothetical protein
LATRGRTAAHCLVGSFSSSTKVVFSFHTSNSTTANISRISEHGYIPEETLNDIAVVQISGQPSSASPIGLIASDPAIGTSVTAIGYGCSSRPYLRGNGRCTSFPKHLRGVALRRVRQDCRDMSDTDFCTEGDRASTNHGDSGGPVMLRRHGRWLLAGLVDLDASGTTSDDTSPYFQDMTSIARELPWINTVVATRVPAPSTAVGPDAFGRMPNPGSLQQAIGVFGHPTTAFTDSSGVDCNVRWDDLGIRALFQDFAVPAGGQCRPQSDFNLSQVTLTGPRWITAAGLRLGDSVAALRRAYPTAPSPADCAVDTRLPASSFRLARVPDPNAGGSYICTLVAVASHGVVTEFVLSSASASE